MSRSCSRPTVAGCRDPSQNPASGCFSATLGTGLHIQHRERPLENVEPLSFHLVGTLQVASEHFGAVDQIVGRDMLKKPSSSIGSSLALEPNSECILMDQRSINSFGGLAAEDVSWQRVDSGCGNREILGKYLM